MCIEFVPDKKVYVTDLLAEIFSNILLILYATQSIYNCNFSNTRKNQVFNYSNTDFIKKCVTTLLTVNKQ